MINGRKYLLGDTSFIRGTTNMVADLPQKMREIYYVDHNYNSIPKKRKRAILVTSAIIK